jgi:hypothetical protein
MTSSETIERVKKRRAENQDALEALRNGGIRFLRGNDDATADAIALQERLIASDDAIIARASGA